MSKDNGIIKNSKRLEIAINEINKNTLSEAQKLALKFALRIAETSRTIVNLTNSRANIEAHAIFRLLLEHLFNFGALLHDENHYNRLLNHSTEEPSRQLQKILDDEKTHPSLTPKNLKIAEEHINSRNKKHKNGAKLNWEQIARSGSTDVFYTRYKTLSFLYAHSTLASLLTDITDEKVGKLHLDVEAAIHMTSLLIRKRLPGIHAED